MGYGGKNNKVRKHGDEAKQEKLWQQILKITVLVLIVAAAAELSIEKSGLIMFGVKVENVDVGGCTQNKAAAKIQERAADLLADKVVLVIEGKKYPYTKGELGLEFDIAAAVDKAYTIGRQGNVWQRLQRRGDYEQVKIPQKWNYGTFTNSIQPLVNLYGVAPAGSLVTEYDENGAVVRQEKNGKYIDINYIFQSLQSSEKGDLEINVPFNKMYAYPTAEQVRKWDFNSKIAEFSTKYDPASNRGRNIEIFAAALNGKMLYPYEVFSVNETAGARTAGKGYLPAPIIVKGKVDNDIGGGICQVVTVLYNAVASSDFTITERHRHSKAPVYVDEGKDAAVAYGYKDFKCYYRGGGPVCFKFTAKNGLLSVEIYGGGSDA